VKVTAAPSGSTKIGTIVSSFANWQFAGDVGGTYVLQAFDMNGTALDGCTLSVEIATRLTHTVRTSTDSASVVIWLWDGRVIATTTPEVSPALVQPQTSLAAVAAKEPTVLAALSLLVGMDAAAVTSTGLPSVAIAFTNACAAPAAVATEDVSTPSLLANGWTKA